MRVVIRETLLEINILPGPSIPKCLVSDQKWWLWGLVTWPMDKAWQDNMFQYVSISAPGIRRQQWELCHWHRPGIVVSSMYPQSSNFIFVVFNRAQINERLILVSLTCRLSSTMHGFLIKPDFALGLTSSKHLWENNRIEGIWSDSYHCTAISLISDMTLLRISKTHRLICHSQMYSPRRWCLTFKHAVLSNASDSCAVAVKIEGFRPGTLEQKQNERRRKLGNHQLFCLI